METTALLLKMISALSIVAGLMFILLWFLRKVNRQIGGKDADGLKVLSVVPLMHKGHIGLVRFGSRLLLVGITEQQITLLDRADVADASGGEFSRKLEEAAAAEQADIETENMESESCTAKGCKIVF